MKVVCQSCDEIYNINDEIIPSYGSKIKCKRCGSPIVVTPIDTALKILKNTSNINQEKKKQNSFWGLKNIIIIILSLSTAGGTFFSLNKFNMLDNKIIGLTNKNKQLSKTTKELKNKNRKLIATNKNLQKRHDRVKKSIIDRNKHVKKRMIIRAEKKVAKAPGALIPIVGTGIVISMTAYEVKETCDDIKEMIKFQNELFPDNNVDNKKYKVCGFDVKKELTSIADEQIKDLKDFFGDGYEVLEIILNNALNSVYENIDNWSEKFSDVKPPVTEIHKQDEQGKKINFGPYVYDFWK